MEDHAEPNRRRVHHPTPRERRLLARLSAAVQQHEISPAVRRTIHAALHAWSGDQRIGDTLFDAAWTVVRRGTDVPWLDPCWPDVDGRLWFHRLMLLGELSRFGRRDATLPRLLAIGDPSPTGWAAAIEPAIAAASGPHVARRTYPAFAVADDLPAALTCFEHDNQAYADGLWRVRFPAVAGQLSLSSHPPSRVHPPVCEIRFVSRTREERTQWDLLPGDWRALSVQIAAINAIEHLALSLGRVTRARPLARRSLVQHVRETAQRPLAPSGDGHVATLVGSLQRLEPRAEAMLDEVVRWTRPPLFALMAGALERLAGEGREPLAEAPPPGSWVDVVDDLSGEALGAGVVLDPAQLRPELQDLLSRRRGEREVVPIELGGAAHLYPLAALRTPPRAQLFDSRIDGVRSNPR